MCTSRRFRLRLQSEVLESRHLLSASPQLEGDFTIEPLARQGTAWLDNELFFAADDGTGDVELWKSDGTAEGTVRVKDIRAGSGGSMPRDLIAINDRVVFTAHTEEFGRELWATDGTESGTVLVRDFAPGSSPSNSLGETTKLDGVLYFSTDNQLWSTDGTEANTRLISEATVDLLTGVGDRLYYTTSTETEATLWRMAGPDTDPQKVKSFSSDSTYKSPEIAVVGDWLYLTTVDHDGHHLWKSDGTDAGTTELSFRGAEFRTLVAGPDFLLYVTYTNGRIELSRTNPADDQTDSIRRKTHTPNAFSSSSFAALGEHIYYTDDNFLYRLAGTQEPELVTQFHVPTQPWRLGANRIREAGGMLYITMRTDAGSQLWRSDGTEEGTHRVETTSVGTEFTQLFDGQDGNVLLWGTSEDTRGLWSSSSDVESTAKILNSAISGPTEGLHPSTSAASEHVIAIGERTYFKIGYQLWQTGGQDLAVVEGATLVE